MWRRTTIISLLFVLLDISLLLNSVHPWIIKRLNIQQQRCHYVQTLKHNSQLSIIIGDAVHLMNKSTKTTTSSISSHNLLRDDSLSEQRQQQQNRRGVLHQLVNSITATGAMLVFTLDCGAAIAAQEVADINIHDDVFRREMNEFRYEISTPKDMSGPNQKPLKTHFDEVNFKSMALPGYEIGITVDPVRITSLIEFGTPEEVAAKVVLAEVNRDGVFDVQLLNDPISGTVTLSDGRSTTTFYQLNYISNGKRGRKRYIAKFYIQNQKLFALTAQCKEDTYEAIQQDMNDAVRSFRVL